ncbi:lysophospholipid acyltransferase family protein [uncultured Marivita sp.]|uniref:lysophospholipid acyltransferase family protein n=1 Tax=uncultured Marivita sp. TaxID=888080 RepID=UPI002616E396|nr:lysophospholipid acyltransferase family protein [uncultured Marivita sp.]
MMENATGRLSLIKRAAGYQDEVAQGRDFWQVMIDRYGLSLDVIGGSLDTIPRQGPLIVIANHPYGILDGLILGHVLSVTRGNFRILAHKVFRKAQDLDRIILPVDFDSGNAAVAQNIATRRLAFDYLVQGGCIGVFPGGTVSTAARPFARPMDPGWRNFTARMIAKSDATVLPIYFDGQTSRLFQLASHLHSTLRMGLLLKEFRNRVDTPVRIVIGAPIPAHEIARRKKDARELMDFLRKATYELSPTPFASFDYGFEFEDRQRARG